MNAIPQSNEAPSGVNPQRRIGMGGPDDPVFTKLSAGILVLVVALFVFTRLWHLTAFSLWTDEIFSLKAARGPWGRMFETLILDKVHPPLFYIILKIWIAIGGQSLLWLKLLPVVTAVVTIIPFFLLCRELNLSARATNVGLLLMAVNGYLIHYAQEVRMYTLLLLFTATSFWLFVRMLNHEGNRKRDFLFLLIANLLLVYTHYFGWLVVGVEGFFLLWRDRRKFLIFSTSVLAVALCFSPWVYLVLRAIWMKQGPTNGLDWIKPPHLSSLVAYFADLCGPLNFPGSTYVRLLLFGGPVLLWFWHVIKRDQTGSRNHRAVFWWLFTSFALPLTFVYMFSILGPKSIWHERQLMISVAPFLLLVVTALDRLHPRWLRAAALLFVVTWSALGGFRDVNEGDDLTRINWQNMASKMVHVESPDVEGIKVYVFQQNVERPIEFYLDETHERRFQPIFVPDVRSVEGQHFWIAFRESREIERGVPPLNILKDKGYRTGEGSITGRPGHRVYLIPVWREAVGTKPA